MDQMMTSWVVPSDLDLLFWIISRVDQNSGIETADDPIPALHHNSMFICIYKFVVQDYSPLGVYHFTPTMCHESSARCLFSRTYRGKVLECIRKLQMYSEMRHNSILQNDLQPENMQYDCINENLAYIWNTWTRSQ